MGSRSLPFLALLAFVACGAPRPSADVRHPADAPAAVVVQGDARTTSTRPSCDSSARMRWLTADGVTERCRAAASNVPWSTTATRAASWSGLACMKQR